MMLPLAEWLRAEAKLVALERLEEAADEIERLQSENEYLKRWLERGDTTLGEYVAENERLRTALEEIAHHCIDSQAALEEIARGSYQCGQCCPDFARKVLAKSRRKK